MRAGIRRALAGRVAEPDHVAVRAVELSDRTPGPGPGTESVLESDKGELDDWFIRLQ